MATKINSGKKFSPQIRSMAERLGVSPEKVLHAVNNLLYGNGAVYRQVVFIPLHGKVS